MQNESAAAKPKSRPSWDQYFLDIAFTVATRSTCLRKAVGAVLVQDRRILATGYGGSIKGQPHCIDVGCDIDPNTGGCVRTVHAEVNAIAQAAKNGVSTENATIYTTLSPCPACFKLLVNAGVIRIVFGELYRIPPDEKLAHQCGVELVNCDGYHAMQPTQPTTPIISVEFKGNVFNITSRIIPNINEVIFVNVDGIVTAMLVVDRTFSVLQTQEKSLEMHQVLLTCMEPK